MQNRQNGRRRRGAGNNPRPMGQPMGGQGNSNRLDVKVRGNAHQLLEKYKMMARDAHQAGDRVAAEYYLQHSDHYFRILNDARMRQEEARARRNIFDPLDEEIDEEQVSVESEDRREPQPARAPRRESFRAPAPEQPEPRAAPDQTGWRPRAPQPAAPPSEPMRMSDGEAALMAFGGRPERIPERSPAARTEAAAPVAAEVSIEDGPAAEAVVVEEPPRRRRGRPRKTEVTPPAGD